MLTPGHSDSAFTYDNDRFQARLAFLLLAPLAVLYCVLIIAGVLGA